MKGWEHKLVSIFVGASIAAVSIGVIAKVISFKVRYLKTQKANCPVLWYS